MPLLGLLHGLDLLSTSLLVGAIVFCASILPAGGPAAEKWVHNPNSLISGCIVFSLILALSWMLCMAVEMSESWKFDELWGVVSGTRFGFYWAIKIGILVLIFLVFHFKRFQAISGIAIFLPLFSSLTGHAGAQKLHLFLSLGFDYVHFLAVSIWTGGLLSLFLTLRRKLSRKDAPLSEAGAVFSLVRRFSHFAMASTALIAISGLVMAYRYGVILQAPWLTDYGKVLLLKTFFFSLALIAASINQFVHIRSWTPEKDQEFTRAIYREVRLEIVFVLVVFIAAGYLTRIALPID